MRWQYVAVALALYGCAAPGANLAEFYHGEVGAPHKGKAALTRTFLTEEMQRQTGLRMLGIMALTGPPVKQRDLLGFARRINAVVVTVRARPDGTYSYDVPEFRWVPGTTTRVDGRVTGSDGSRSYVSGTARTSGRLETTTKTVTRTRYSQAILFWGYSFT